MIYFIDILEAGLGAVLLLHLCSGMITWKRKYVKQGKYIFFLLFVIWGYWLANSVWLDRLLYGDDMIPKRSSISIVRLALMMAVCFLLIDFFYSGSRLIKGYLVLLYETVTELSRFGIHGVWSLFAKAFYDYLTKRLSEEKIPFGTFESFNNFLVISQYVWQLLLTLLYITVAWLTICAIHRYRRSMQDISRQGVMFLMLSPAVGMAFSVAMRCIFYKRTGAQVEYIYDRHGGMYAIIPLMTFLCLLSIIYSVRIYEELMRTQEEKSSLIFYKQQLSDMTEHVQEMERLYDGIRGMRHDMNNYIADMEQLLGVGMHREKNQMNHKENWQDNCQENRHGNYRGNHQNNSQGGLEASIESEAEKYLHHMKSALDAMTLKFSTGNPVTDVIMNRKYQECEKEGIDFTSDFIFSEQLGVEAFDMGILLNNALDNAIEGCNKRIGKDHACIRVHSYSKGIMFFLRIENDCNEKSVQYTQDNILRTTKEDDWMHGIGLKNMQSVAERYYGTMSYEIRDGVFFLTIMLQGKQT